MDNTKIDWCDSTWNPVTGCLHGCKYCYARSIAHRFGGNFTMSRCSEHGFLELYAKPENPYPDKFSPTFHRYRLNDYIGKNGRNIFVCSMADLFGEWVPDEWIKEVFAACEKAPQHKYLFLTKNPKRYIQLQNDGKLIRNDNMWYGASVTDRRSWKKVVDAFGDIRCSYKLFLSVEPILERVVLAEKWNDCAVSNYVDWVIVGAETGRRKDKIIPRREWIEQIVEDCREFDIPLFMKSSLADIWGEPLIQELPAEFRKGDENEVRS